MKICAISQYNPAVPLRKRADKKQLENHEQYLQDKNIRKYSSNYSNYVIPFTGEVKKNKLPDKLRVASIQDCQPVNDGDSQKDTERLSAVLSTALAGIGSAWGVGLAGQAAAGVVAEDPDLRSASSLFPGKQHVIAEIYGLHDHFQRVITVFSSSQDIQSDIDLGVCLFFCRPQNLLPHLYLVYSII